MKEPEWEVVVRLEDLAKRLKTGIVTEGILYSAAPRPYYWVCGLQRPAEGLLLNRDQSSLLPLGRGTTLQEALEDLAAELRQHKRLFRVHQGEEEPEQIDIPDDLVV